MLAPKENSPPAPSMVTHRSRGPPARLQREVELGTIASDSRLPGGASSCSRTHPPPLVDSAAPAPAHTAPPARGGGVSRSSAAASTAGSLVGRCRRSRADVGRRRAVGRAALHPWHGLASAAGATRHDRHHHRERQESRCATACRSARAAPRSCGDDDRDLGRGQQRCRQRRQHEWHDARLRPQAAAPGPQHRFGPHQIRPLAGQLRQRQQVHRRHRGRRRLGAVVLLPGAAAPTGPRRSSRTSRRRRASRTGRRASVQRPRPLQPGRLAVGLEQLEQSPDEVRVVLGEAVDPAAPAA